MQTTQQSIETELLARKLRRQEEAKRTLSRASGKNWPVVIGALPVLTQSFFGKQLENWLGYSAQATWVTVLILSALLYASLQIAVLHRKVAALQYMLEHGNSDA